MAWPTTNGIYDPVSDRSDKILETPEEYVQRMQKLLPKFPGDVLRHFFYEHRDGIDHFAWLDYPKLRFRQEVLPTVQITELRKSVDVAHLIGFLASGHSTPRFDRLRSYFDQHGTWPVPPILLANPHGQLAFPNGARCLAPLDVMEGRHRMTTLISFADAGKPLSADHRVWVVYR